MTSSQSLTQVLKSLEVSLLGVTCDIFKHEKKQTQTQTQTPYCTDPTPKRP